MQILITSMLTGLMLAILILFFKMKKYNQKAGVSRLRATAISMEFILLCEIIIVFAKERQLAYFGFSMYYIALAIYIFLMVRFSIAYVGYKGAAYYKEPLFWITVCEAILFLWGLFSQELFTIMHVRWFGQAMWAARRYTVFYVFSGLCVLVLFGSMLNLLIATVRSVRIYRMKYLGVSLVSLFVIMFYLFTQFRQAPLVAPVVLFAVGELAIIYMAVYYAPKKLKEQALLFVADKLNDGIVLYDDEHHLQFVTDSFKTAFEITDTNILLDEVEYWTGIMKDINTEIVWNGEIKTIVRDGQEFHYELQKKSFSENGKNFGTVYWIQDVTEAIDNYEKMLYRANYDELTGLYKEPYFHEECRKLLNENPDTTFVMVCSKVENFNFFMDLFGREKGKEYILDTAELLKTGLAKYERCRYSRIEGNGFYILLPKEDFDEQEMLKFVDIVAKKFSTTNYQMRVLLGVYELVDRSVRMTSVCHRAASACDVSIGDFKRRVMWFDDSVQRDIVLSERLNAELSGAIKTNQIKIYLQPQMNNDGKIIGAEALARWEHPELGLIPPVKFIPAFENSGRITELDICIWRKACEKLKEWKNAGRDDLYISVNISAKDLYSLNIYDYYMDLIGEYGISPKNLKLEITESAIINDLRQHVNLIDRLQEAGFEVEMDDFGSAYSSFNMLKDICVDVLKIDMKFLGETENTQRSEIILKSIVDLAKSLNMKTVAEGVETKNHFEFLRSAGCDTYQGYYFSKPMKVEDFEKTYMA